MLSQTAKLGDKRALLLLCILHVIDHFEVNLQQTSQPNIRPSNAMLPIEDAFLVNRKIFLYFLISKLSETLRHGIS